MSASLARGLNSEVRAGRCAASPRRSPRTASRAAAQWAAGDRDRAARSREDAAARSRPTVRTRSTRAGSPIASPTTWRRTAGSSRRRISRRTRRRSARRSRHVPRLRDHLDAAAELRRHRAGRDAEHARGARASRRSRAARSRRMHLVTEAMRRAYLDRARFLGDPDFVRGAGRELTSKSHARDARQDDRSAARRRAAPSSARTSSRVPQPPEPDDTTHFSVVDKDGMAVSNTYTLEGGYGSHVVIKGTGILLNNEMGDFNKKPGDDEPDGRHRHAAEPHRAGQAHAELDDADDRHEKRQARARHRIARRPDDHQHRAERRAERHGVEPHGPRSRRCAAHRIISGCRIDCTIEMNGVSDGRCGQTAGARPRRSNAAAAGIGAVDLVSSDYRDGVWRRRHAGSDGEGE